MNKHRLLYPGRLYQVLPDRITRFQEKVNFPQFTGLVKVLYRTNDAFTFAARCIEDDCFGINITADDIDWEAYHDFD